MAVKNLIGLKFGNLTVLSLEKRINGRTWWNCLCDCGQITTARADKLNSGKAVSCGCVFKQNIVKFFINKTDATSGRNTIHGMTNTRFYTIWKGMKARCLNPNVKCYDIYGGRGITVCDEWLEFNNFKKEMYDSYLNHVYIYGEKDTSIDRINVNGNYNKLNCRWATWKEQGNNKRSNIS